MLGRRRTVLAGVAGALALAAAQAAPGAGSTRTLVFSATPSGTQAAQLFRVQTDGSGLKQLTTGSAPATDPAFSADGKKLAFVRLGSGIYRVNLDGSGLKRLTSGSRDSYPSWSPDGARIVFLRPTKARWSVFVMPASGGKQRLLAHAPPAGRPQWARDGKSILVPTQSDVSKIDPRTGRVLQRIDLTADLVSSQAATVSPNEKTLAYVTQRPPTGPEDCGESPCPRFGLYLQSAGKKAKRIGDDTGPAGWSPDGKTLVYVAKGALTFYDLGSGKKTSISTGSHAAAGDAPPAWQP